MGACCSVCSWDDARAILFGCSCIFAMGGSIFGISALYSDEYEYALYSDVCNQPRSCRHHSGGVPCCPTQLSYVSLFSSIGFFLNDAAAAPWGELVDRAGPRVCLTCAACMGSLGLAFLGAAALVDIESIDTPQLSIFMSHGFLQEADVLASLGLIMVGCAGPGVFAGVYVGLLALSTSVGPAHTLFEASLSTFAAGAEDLSSLVFSLFNIADHHGVPLPASFFTWACICVGLTLLVLRYALRPKPPRAVDEARQQGTLSESTTLLVPKPSAPAPAATPAAAPATTSPEIETSTGSPAAAPAPPSEAAALDRRSWVTRVWAAVQTAKRAVWTTHNIILVSLMSMINLASSHHLVSHGEYLTILFGDATASAISALFDIAFPVLGFCAALFMSPILTADHPWVPFICLSILVNTWLALSIIPIIETQYLASVVFGPMRTLQWASFYHIIGTNTMLYEPKAVGRILGYNGLAIAILGAALSPLLMMFAQAPANIADQRWRYLANRVALLCIILPTSAAFPYYLKSLYSKPPKPAK